jgi:hypothetical protein
MKLGKNFATIVAVLVIAFLVVNPGLWIPAFGLLFNVMLFCLAARIVSKLVFGKSLRELLFDK